MLILPSPPSLLLAFVHASKLYSLSVLAKTTCAPRAAKSAARSLKAMISVGHTKVQAMGTKPRTSHCFVDVYCVRLRSVCPRACAGVVSRRFWEDGGMRGWWLVGGTSSYHPRGCPFAGARAEMQAGWTRLAYLQRCHPQRRCLRRAVRASGPVPWECMRRSWWAD